MTDKSTYRSISEVSKILDVPTHVLRFWETQFQEIKPVHRIGGRRYYRQEDVDLLTIIKDYLYKEHYTIKGVQKILRSKALEKTGNQPVQDFITEIKEVRRFLDEALSE